MKIAVFGLGYVGSVTAACLAKMGHAVWGTDPFGAKVEMINAGQSPVAEKGLDALVSWGVRNHRLRATLNPTEAVRRADVSLIAVGTPSGKNGSVNLDYVKAVAGEIGRALRKFDHFHTIALRSTVPPGTTAKVVLPLLERASGKRAGQDFGVAFHPEFLREGSSVHDFFHPARTVIGSRDPHSTRVLVRLWQAIRAPLIRTSLETAEMVKYADNSFHALKICFANEIGMLCRGLGICGQEVMDIFVRDTKLNISPLYLRPGFAFGGPCLPKDVRALCSMARETGVETPLMEGILRSNSRHLRRGIDLVIRSGRKKIGILGLAFKSDTDDLRESPGCALVKALLRANRRVKIYDPMLNFTKVVGAKRTSIQKEIPSLPALIANSLEEVLNVSEVVVITCDHPEFRSGINALRPGQILIDFVNSTTGGRSEEP